MARAATGGGSDLTAVAPERAVAPPRRLAQRRERSPVSTAGIAKPPPRGEIESAMLDFLAYLELERGLSRNTLEAYRSDLLQFGRFLERRGVGVTTASHNDLAAFLSELAGPLSKGADGRRRPAARAALGGQGGGPRALSRPHRPEGALAPH